MRKPSLAPTPARSSARCPPWAPWTAPACPLPVPWADASGSWPTTRELPGVWGGPAVLASCPRSPCSDPNKPPENPRRVQTKAPKSPSVWAFNHIGRPLIKQSKSDLNYSPAHQAGKMKFQFKSNIALNVQERTRTGLCTRLPREVRARDAHAGSFCHRGAPAGGPGPFRRSRVLGPRKSSLGKNSGT